MKTYVFDASAVLGFLKKKSGATKINEILKESMRGHAEILMSAVNYGEVYSAVLRAYNIDQADATMTAVRSLPIRLLDVTPQSAVRASDVRVRYKLYYIDSFAAALAIEYKATLVTSDSDFRKLGHSVSVLWLKPQ